MPNPTPDLPHKRSVSAARQSWHLLICTVCLVACQSNGPLSSPAPHSIAGSEARLERALIMAYAAFDLQAPHPTIRVVRRDHPVLRGGTLAISRVEPNGREWIYFQARYVASGKPLMPLVMHEIAHLKTWRRFGHGIASHGAEFNAVCSAATDIRDCRTQLR